MLATWQLQGLSRETGGFLLCFLGHVSPAACLTWGHGSWPIRQPVAVLAPFGEVVERLLQIEQSEQASNQTWTLGYGTVALPNVPGLPGTGASCCRSCATCRSAGIHGAHTFSETASGMP